MRKKWLRYIALFKRYSPHIVLGLIVLVLVVMVFSRDSTLYTNKTFDYSVRFPEGWVRDYVKPYATSYRAPAIMPITNEPEAAVVIGINDKFPAKDLAEHFRLIVEDISGQGYRLLNSGITSVGLQEARWVEFQDTNGINNHVWYVLFDPDDNVVIIQNRISIPHADKYRDTLTEILENFRFIRG